MRTLPIPPTLQSSWSDTLAVALADRLPDGSVEFTHRKYTSSNAYIDFLQEVLTKATSNKFKMSWRPYGEPYPRREQDRKKLTKSSFPFETCMI